MSDVQDQLQRLLTASRQVAAAASLALPDAVRALAAVVEEIDQADRGDLVTPAGVIASAMADRGATFADLLDEDDAEDGSCEHCPADGGPCNVCTPPTPAGWGPLST